MRDTSAPAPPAIAAAGLRQSRAPSNITDLSLCSRNTGTWADGALRGIGAHCTWLPWISVNYLNGITGLEDLDKDLSQRLANRNCNPNGSAEPGQRPQNNPMKNPKILLSCLLLSGLMTGNLMSQQPAVLKIDLDRSIGEVDPNIYGAFVEPIRTVVYGTIYDPKSPLAEENGFRKDFIELVKELKIPVVRWPGGNFVSGYNWKDGVGPKDQRPARLDLAWHQIESNQMGTDEYVKLCGLIGAENFICINAGLGTLDEARHWIEYCNYEKGTYYSDLRRKYGNEKPFNVKYWALGNEIDGPWQMGQKSAEDYCKFAVEAAKNMQWVDRNAKFIACGASNYRSQY